MSEYCYVVILIPEEEGGFSVEVPSLPGCHTQGETIEEAMLQAQDAIQLYVDYLKEAGKPIPPSGSLEPIIQTVKVKS